MRIGETIGTVTLSRVHPSLAGGTLRLVVPLSLENLLGRSHDRAEALVLFDTLGAGNGSLVAFTEGGEAAQPFRPLDKPVDAYNGAILDRLDIDPAAWDRREQAF